MNIGDKIIIEFPGAGLKPIQIETKVLSMKSGEAMFEDKYGDKYNGLFINNIWVVKKIN